jgi:hypothetical protein
MTTATIKKASPSYDDISYDDVLNCFKLTTNEIINEFGKVNKYNSQKRHENSRSFVGNKILYHATAHELLKTRRHGKEKTLQEIFNDEELKKYWINQTIKMDRRKKNDYIDARDIFECYRRCKGSVQFYKVASANWLYNKYNAKKILDPCAGWGGRLLGTYNTDAHYTGIDTNVNLKSAYELYDKYYTGMKRPTMIWKSCLDVDFSQIEYDFVLTSPPYYNVEEYSHMELWANEKQFYQNFLTPLIVRCLAWIKKGGVVCFNISDYMYDKCMLYSGSPYNNVLRPCDDKFPLLQQNGGKRNKEFIYVWKK